MPTTLRKVGKHLSGWPFDQVTGFCVVMEDLDAANPDHPDYDGLFVETIAKIKRDIFGLLRLDSMVTSALLATFIKDSPELCRREGENHLPLRTTLAVFEENGIKRNEYDAIARELMGTWTNQPQRAWPHSCPSMADH